jgi:hypothetical protein
MGTHTSSRLVVAGLTLLLAGCWPFGASGQRDALDSARSTWESRGFSSYEFRVQRICFCAPPATAPLLVRVQDGRPVSVTNADTGAPVSPDTGMPLTVDALFTVLDDAIDRDAARIDVQYDEALGYPLSMYIDYDERIADEEVTYQASGLRALR